MEIKSLKMIIAIKYYEHIIIIIICHHSSWRFYFHGYVKIPEGKLQLQSAPTYYFPAFKRKRFPVLMGHEPFQVGG